jgi:hypothetical protein
MAALEAAAVKIVMALVEPLPVAKGTMAAEGVKVIPAAAMAAAAGALVVWAVHLATGMAAMAVTV